MRLEANGVSGSLVLDGDRLILKKKGWPYGHKSEKTIPLRSITATQWKPAGLLTNGYIQMPPRTRTASCSCSAIRPPLTPSGRRSRRKALRRRSPPEEALRTSSDGWLICGTAAFLPKMNSLRRKHGCSAKESSVGA
jgi:hypothetical protein